MFLGPYLEADLYQFSVTLKTVHGRGTMSSKHPPAWPASALTHASWQGSHLLTTVRNAYYYFPTVPETSSPTQFKAWAISLLHSLMREAYFRDISWKAFVYHSITIRSIIPYHPHHLNTAVELTFLRTVNVSTINTK